MADVNHPLPAEGAIAALNSISSEGLSTLKSLNMEEIVETPFGAMPGGQFIMVPITDMIVHTWDVAKATGQNTTLASGLAVLTPEEKEHGAVLVDIGGGTTDIVAFRRGQIHYSKVIPVGGWQFTNDICLAFNTPFVAEQQTYSAFLAEPRTYGITVRAGF